MLLFGPLADSLGRRPLAIFGLTGFTLSSVALAQVNSPELFLGLRATQAFCGAAATVVVPGLVRQLYQEHTAKGMSYLSMMMMLAPLLAPSIGSAILWFSHWRSIFIVLALYGAIIFTLVWKWLPEISQPIQADKPLPTEAIERGFFNSYKAVFANRTARPMIASMLFGSFAFFCFITAVSFVYINYFGVSEQTFSLLFGVNVLCLIGANFINSRLVTRVGSLRMLHSGLWVGLVSAMALCTVNYLELGIIWTVITIAPLMGALTLMGTNADAIVLMNFPHNSGTATAVTGTLRFGSGAFAGPLLAYFYTGTALPFSLLMLAGVSGVALCQLWYMLANKTDTN
jgi:DHA1 family bicyclomycin/chloramphenicol resistance-like MFS transporter